jgi:hypothetical protein
MAEGGTGVALLLAGIVGLLAYRSGRRRGGPPAGGGPAPSGPRARGDRDGLPEDLGPLREVRLPDGRDALQVSASLFFREEGDLEEWRWVVLEDSAACQEAIALTRSEVAPGEPTAQDVPVVLMPVGTPLRVDAVDAYATGGRIGRLPDGTVRTVGEAIRTTHLATGQPCAVLGRIAADASGRLGVELLMPETFEPGPAAR